MRDVFKDPPKISFRWDKNLFDVLVLGKTNRALKSTRSSCKPGCGNCGILSQEVVTDTSQQNTHSPASDFTCRTRNVIFWIICTRCNSMVCVWETECELRESMSEHLRDVPLQKAKPIIYYFGEGKHAQNDVAFVVLENLYSAYWIERQLREGLWIKVLATVRPDGCNVKDRNISVSFWHNRNTGMTSLHYVTTSWSHSPTSMMTLCHWFIKKNCHGGLLKCNHYSESFMFVLFCFFLKNTSGRNFEYDLNLHAGRDVMSF